jgi:hypothetical protein
VRASNQLPTPTLVFVATAFFNATLMFISAMQEQQFSASNTLALLNTQNTATQLSNLIAEAVANSTSNQITLRDIPIIQNTPFIVSLTLAPSFGSNWTRMALSAGGIAGLQRIVNQAVERVIANNIKSGTYQLNVRVDRNPADMPLRDYTVCILNIQIEGRSVFED